jgi:hypothetical protein
MNRRRKRARWRVGTSEVGKAGHSEAKSGQGGARFRRTQRCSKVRQRAGEGGHEISERRASDFKSAVQSSGCEVQHD